MFLWVACTTRVGRSYKVFCTPLKKYFIHGNYTKTKPPPLRGGYFYGIKMFIHGMYPAVPKLLCDTVTKPFINNWPTSGISVFLPRIYTWASLYYTLEEIVNRTSVPMLEYPSLELTDMHILKYTPENWNRVLEGSSLITSILTLNDKHSGGDIVFKEEYVADEARECGSLLVFDSEVEYHISELTRGVKYILVAYFEQAEGRTNTTYLQRKVF